VRVCVNERIPSCKSAPVSGSVCACVEGHNRECVNERESVTDPQPRSVCEEDEDRQRERERERERGVEVHHSA